MHTALMLMYLGGGGVGGLVCVFSSVKDYHLFLIPFWKVILEVAFSRTGPAQVNMERRGHVTLH